MSAKVALTNLMTGEMTAYPLAEKTTISPLFFGYHKDDHHVTTCLLVEKDELNQLVRILAKGISICAGMDQFSRKMGRVIAEGRAHKALKLASKFGGTDRRAIYFGIIRNTASDTLTLSGHGYRTASKGIVNPGPLDLTEHERKTLNL